MRFLSRISFYASTAAIIATRVLFAVADAQVGQQVAVEYRFDYYMYGQFMKFIRPGAVRVASGESSKELAHVAFRGADGAIALVVANNSKQNQDCRIAWKGLGFDVALPMESVTTFRWR